MDDFWPVDGDLLSYSRAYSTQPWSASPGLEDASPPSQQLPLGSTSPTQQLAARPDRSQSRPSLPPRSSSLPQSQRPFDIEQPLHSVESPHATSSNGPSSPAPLSFLDPADWDELNSYREDVPTYIHYAIQWKLRVNNRSITTDTEQDVVLAPAAYWHMCLKEKVERLAEKKLAYNKDRQVQCEEANVTVTVKERGKRALVKRFDGMDIDWSVVADQLTDWAELTRTDKEKRMRVELVFVFSQPSGSGGGGSGPQALRRGTVTQRQSTELGLQTDAEEASNGGRAATWRAVYQLMRCPGGTCKSASYCWIDAETNAHHVLKQHHLRALIKHVEDGGTLSSHDDVPAELQEQLRAEERQRQTRQSKVGPINGPACPPIQITNVLPSSRSEPLSDSIATGLSGITQNSLLADLDGPRDAAVREYSDWQSSQVASSELKAAFQLAGDIALEEGMDLEQVHGHRDVDLFVKRGVKRGVAHSFVRDVERWAKRFKAV